MATPLLAAIVALLAIILLSLWAVLYQLVKQQGRMLLRLDGVEHRMGLAGPVVHPIGGIPLMQQAADEPAGLGVGTPVASFRLADLDGEEVALEDFRGKRVLLVYWSPHCGFCDLLAPDLARLRPDLRGEGVEVLLVAHGDAEANRRLAQEHQLEAPILLLPKDGSVAIEAFHGQGTPSAYLLDEEGRVARPLSVGSVQVLEMAQSILSGKAGRKKLPGERDLSTSKLVRDGLKAGTPAPLFTLPDVRGGTVSLEEFRGRRVLLVFSDPNCGPCDELAPHLVRMHEHGRDGDPAVIVVGRGDPDENRRKAEAHGFEFPVVLQERWKLSQEYGIFATPVAFLIDERGVIARDVAQGIDAIRALVPMAINGEARPGRLEVR